MSTYDVPGANPANADQLAMGCWAEHEDGSLIFVESVEAGKVIYSIFDVAKDPPVEYRDAMLEYDFKKTFTWDPKAKTKKDDKWLWHDKTPFPWTKVMEDFPAGSRAASAAGTMNAAERVAESLSLRAEKVRERQLETMSPQKIATAIMEGISKALKNI